MQNSSINEQIKISSGAAGARKMASSSQADLGEVNALRGKVDDLTTKIGNREDEASKIEAAISSSDSAASADLESIPDLAGKTVADLTAASKEIKAQINRYKEEAETNKLLAELTEYEDYANKNKEAYEGSLSSFADQAQQMMKEDPEHADLLKQAFKYQAKVGKEGIEFWNKEANFWNSEISKGAPSSEQRQELAALYDEIFATENQINDSFGSGKKDDQNTMRNYLSSLQDKVTALRSSL